MPITTKHIKNTTIKNEDIAANTITGASLAANSVNSFQIAANSVAKGDLDPGIEPEWVVKFGAIYTTTGGAAAEAITVTGALATDICHVMLKAPGSTPVTVSYAAVTTDTLTVTFSADPSNDHDIYYQILRAAV